MERLNFETKGIKKNLLTEKVSTPEYDFNFEIADSESDEEYLHRANLYIYNKTKENSRFNLAKLYNYDTYNTESNRAFIKKILDTILSSKLKQEKINPLKNEKILSELVFFSSSRKYDGRGNSNVAEGYEFFNETNQTRRFFPKKFRGKDNFPYSATLFGVITDIPETKDYLKRKLDDKSVCLLGGGKSIQDITKNLDIKLRSLVNIDPFITEEDIERNIKNNYKSINIKADDPFLINKIKKEGISEKFDEVWASYSVPFYNVDPKEINSLFNNIENLLAEGGNCRITPLQTQNDNCGEEILKRLKKMNSSGKYNFHLFYNTLIIHKIKKNNNESLKDFQ